MKIKILYVIENSFFGGGERAFAQIINGLNKENFEIYVACLSRKDLHLRDEPRSTGSASEVFIEKIEKSAEIIPFDLRNRFNLMNFSRLAKIMKEKNIQIVHSQGARADFFARLAARRAKIPVVVSTIAMPVEGFDVNFLKKAIYIALDHFSEKFVDKFIVVSDALRKRLIEKHRISPEKVSVIYNGVEIEDYKGDIVTGDVVTGDVVTGDIVTGDAVTGDTVTGDVVTGDIVTGDTVRKEFGIGKDTLLVGTIGRLVWQKGLPYFIEAAKLVTGYKLQVTGEVKFLIVGEGNQRKNLESLICNLKLDDKVILTGFRKDVKEILSALDIFVLPSIREGQPIILLEAMAMVKPIIATNIEGVNETVIDGKTGILVPPENPKTLAEAILRLARDKEQRKKMGLAGRKLIEEKFNINKIIGNCEQLYEDFIRGTMYPRSK